MDKDLLIIIGLLVYVWIVHIQLSLLWAWYRSLGLQLQPLKVHGKEWKDHLSTKQKYKIVAFIVYDWWCNYTSMTFNFMQLPKGKNELVTGRLSRNRQIYEHMEYCELSWIEARRKMTSDVVCDRMLDPYDPTGDHC